MLFKLWMSLLHDEILCVGLFEKRLALCRHVPKAADRFTGFLCMLMMKSSIRFGGLPSGIRPERFPKLSNDLAA